MVKIEAVYEGHVHVIFE